MIKHRCLFYKGLKYKKLLMAQKKAISKKKEIAYFFDIILGLE